MRCGALLVSSSIAVVIGCGTQPSTPPVTDREPRDDWQNLAAALDVETGLAVFTNPFSCGLTSEELSRLRELGASKESRLAFVLLTNLEDSVSVAAAAHDMGFPSHRSMSHSRFRAIAGADYRLPLFALFKRGRPAVIVSDVMPRRLEALEAFF